MLQIDKKDLKTDNENIPPSQCHLDGRDDARCEKTEQEQTFISWVKHIPNIYNCYCLSTTDQIYDLILKKKLLQVSGLPFDM